jgi:hypothetical protein
MQRCNLCPRGIYRWDAQKDQCVGKKDQYTGKTIWCRQRWSLFNILLHLFLPLLRPLWHVASGGSVEEKKMTSRARIQGVFWCLSWVLKEDGLYLDGQRQEQGCRQISISKLKCSGSRKNFVNRI